MNRRLISYCFAIGLPQIISVVTLLILSSNFGSELYAKIAIFESVMFFLQATIGLAVGRSASRFFIDGDGNYIISLASSVVMISSLLLFLISSFLFTYLNLFSIIGVSYTQYTMLYISSLGYILTAISLVKYQFENETTKYLLLSVLKASLLLGSIYLSVLVLGMGTNAFPVSHLFAGLSLVIISILINRPRLIVFHDLKVVKNMLLYSLPFVPTLIAAWILSWSNRFFMVNEIPLSEIGVYSIIQRFCMVYFIVTQACTVFFTPVMYRKLQQNMVSEVSNISIKVISAYFTASIVLLIALTYFLVWNYDYEYKLTFSFVAMLMVVNFLSSITAVSTNIFFNYYKKTLIQMYIYLCVAALSLLLNYYLIPEFRMYGVFFALVFPLVILNFVHALYFYSAKEFKRIATVVFLITLLLTFVSASIFMYGNIS